MKKAFPILIFSVLLILFTSIFLARNLLSKELPETTLLRCFSNSGATAVNSEIYFWGRVSGKNSSDEEIKKLALNFTENLGIDKKAVVSKVVSNDIARKVELNCTNMNKQVISITVQAELEQKVQSNNYVTVNVSGNIEKQGLEEIRKTVLSTFKKFGVTPKVSSCITGSYSGKLDNDRLNSICEKIFKEAGARKVDSMRDRNLVSVAAYSPGIEDYIRLNGKKVNINLAIRYNSYENKTYIWLATPVITTEY